VSVKAWPADDSGDKSLLERLRRGAAGGAEELFERGQLVPAGGTAGDVSVELLALA
jgi:hypothetical protein